MMKENVLKLLVLLFCPFVSLMAQESVNMKFGKPTSEELSMSVYASDPDADAVVLCRLTDVEYTVQVSSYLVDYREKVRIKVLKPGGERFAKVVVPYRVGMSVGNNITGLRSSFMTIPMERMTGNSSFQEQDGPMSEGVFGTDGDEMVEEVKATAYNLEGGKVVKSSLKKGDIVTTKLDDHRCEVSFEVPGVKVGTVIEYEYKIHSQLFWELRDWYAQCEIPVVYAKLDMNIPNYLIFNIEDHGIQRLTHTVSVGSLKYKVETDPLTTPMSVNTNHYVYVGRNLMGLRKDDWVWNVEDYCAGITAELKQYRLRGMNQMDYATSWEQVDEMILSSDDLGIRLKDHSPLEKELKDAGIGAIADLRERVMAVYGLVMSKVKWNGRYELSPVLPSETLKKGEGTNADINLLLIQSLHDVGLVAAPVLLRTRDLGQLPYHFPTIRKLSTFIVGVIMPTGGNIYLDASNEGGKLNMLPESMLVERARLLQKDKKSEWVNLQKVSKREVNTVIDAKLTEDGVLTGKWIGSPPLPPLGGERKGFLAPLPPHGGEQGGLEGSELKIEGVRGVDGEISICPFPSEYQIENPFTAEERKLPVEFPTIFSRKVVINIALPDGYRLVGEPRNTSVTIPDKGIEGRILTHVGEGSVQLSCQFSINKLSYPVKDYGDLRQLFEMLEGYTKEKLVFRTEN